MKFITVPCHRSLLPFIRNYWQLEAYCTDKGVQQVFSNGAASLHFYLAQGVMLDSSKKLYRTSLNRHDLNCMKLEVERGALKIFGVEFVPFCSRLFFYSDYKEFHIEPSDMNDAEFEELSGKVHEASSNEERASLLDCFFLKRLSELPLDERNLERMSDVFREIVPTDGREAVPPHFKEYFSPEDLASAAHIGQKQFTRVFHKCVGMNPKSYLRLLRFHKALQELQTSNHEDSLTDVAWRCGYYDLSHMISDFRALCGYSPSELLKERNSLTEAFQPKFSGLMRKKIKIENLI